MEGQHHSEDLTIFKGTKDEKYKNILPQILSLVSDNQRLMTNASNIAAALKQQFNWWWVGFYFAQSDKEQLYLGPFQGPVACLRIRKGKGVCGASWQRQQTVIVGDVETFPGHIACSSKSKSQIVVPIIVNNKLFGVLDVDSQHLNHFDEIDKKHLENLILELVNKNIFK